MTSRFTVEKAEHNRVIIYDNQGIDDYYFVDDTEELKKLCKYLNKRECELKDIKEKNQKLYSFIIDYLIMLDFKLKELEEVDDNFAEYRIIKAKIKVLTEIRHEMVK